MDKKEKKEKSALFGNHNGSLQIETGSNPMPYQPLSNPAECTAQKRGGLEMDDQAVCMQAKVKELGGVSAEQTSQIAALREELQGSLAELDQVCFLAYLTPNGLRSQAHFRVDL